MRASTIRPKTRRFWPVASVPLVWAACATPALQSGRGFEPGSSADPAAVGFERDRRFATDDLSSLADPGPFPPRGEAIEGSNPGVVTGSPALLEPSSSQGERPPLLAWDGGVVEGPTPGAVLERGTPQHGIEPSATGRMHIIELYQNALDERDSLIDERTELRSMLAAAQEALAANQANAATLEGKLLELQGESESLRAELSDLAARLVTAQIRRLEAEKLLLESQIQSRRQGPALRSPADPTGPSAARRAHEPAPAAGTPDPREGGER
jgi:hypothetical protein